MEEKRKGSHYDRQSLNTEGKDIHLVGQRQAIFKSFFERPKTMLEVSRETGIERANICRYVAQLECRGLIFGHAVGLCPISGHKATFYSTNIKNRPINEPKRINEIMNEMGIGDIMRREENNSSSLLSYTQRKGGNNA